MLENATDIQLMEQVKTGDARAFRRLVNRHFPKAHAIARRVLSIRQDAEEAVQDAFSKVWVKAQQFDPARAAFGTWFYRILTNTCLDRIRQKGASHLSLDGLEEVVADDASGQDEDLAAGEQSAQVRDAVQALPERQRMAIVLCYFEEMTNAEAAEVMGMHIKALEGLLVRARKDLRERLGG